MSSIEQGELKFFHPDRGFGFVYVLDAAGNRTGEEIYFNVKKFCDIGSKPWGEEPFFKRATFTPVMTTTRLIVFERTQRGNRVSCAKWGKFYKWDVHRALLQFFPPCRVTRVYRGNVDAVLWQSPVGLLGTQNVRDLADIYPKTGDDELSTTYKDDAIGDVEDGLRIEIWTPEKSNYREPWGTTVHPDMTATEPSAWYPSRDIRPRRIT